MSKIIKLTEEQLKEVEDMTFDYGLDSDISFNDGSKVTADGQLDDENYGNPMTSDQYASDVTPQWPFCAGRGIGNR